METVINMVRKSLNKATPEDLERPTYHALLQAYVDHIVKEQKRESLRRK